jgi:hypothetical protein
MTEFTIPATLEDFGAMSFVACPSLETITVEEGNPNFMVKDNVLYDTAGELLYLYPAGRTDTSFTVPEDVLVIYAGSFFAAGYLESITFNDGLQYIGEMAFDFCSGLTSLTIPESVTTICSTAFSDCTALTEVNFVGAEDEDATGKDLTIESYAFFCCDNLKEVTLPKRVTSIGDYAFGCTIPDDDDTSDSIVTVDSDSDSTDSFSVKPIDGFLLIGYTGVASDYVKNCQADLSFKALNFDWSALVFWVVLVAVILVVLVIAIRVIRKCMMTKEEKAALKAAEEIHKVPLNQRDGVAEDDMVYDDGYRSIIDDDEDDEPQAVASYEETLTHGMTHSYGHSETTQETEDQEK